MTKILKCKFCGKLPHMMICKGDDIETEYKLSHNCIFRQNLYSDCGNWYETRRMAILDWNMHRCNRKGGIYPRRNNYMLRQPEKYYPSGGLKIMTKEELRDYYKIIERNKVNDDIEVIDLYNKERSINRHVRLLFAYNKLYYTGDMGSYTFGGTIYNVRTFFKGNYINPFYWQEKVEAYGKPLINTDVSYDKVVDEVDEFLRGYEELFTDSNLDEYTDEVKDSVWSFHNRLESNEYRAYDQITELFDELEISYDSENVATIIRACQDWSLRFLYACEVIQWVENEILED